MTIDFHTLTTFSLPLIFLSTVAFANGNDVKGCDKEDPNERTYTHDGLECDLCPPGFIVREHCTSFMPSRCTQCPAGKYMTHYNECQKCWLCTETCSGLYQIVVQECNSTHPKVCGCQEGTYPGGDGGQCFKPQDFCPPGKRVHIQVTGRITVVCRNCPPKTYSSKPNKRTWCLPRRNCTAEGRDFAWLGNSTHDTVCKNISLVTDDIRATSEANMMTEKPDITTHPQGISTSDQGNEMRPPTCTTIHQKNKTRENKTSDNKKDSNAWQIGVGIGVSVVLIAFIGGVYYCCYRNTQKKKQKCGISKKAKKKFRAALSQETTSTSSESDEDVGLTATTRELLQRTITLKQDKSSEDFLQGIATNIRLRYWKLLIKNLPSPTLTGSEIDNIKYMYKRDGLYEVVYKCLLKWNQKQTGDSFSVKDILELLFHYDKQLVSTLIREYCDCEQLTG